MAEKLPNKEMVPIEELAISNMYVQEALVRLLVSKGILTVDEIMEQLKVIKAEANQGK